MNKLFQKVAALTLGLAMASGAVIAASAGHKDSRPVRATDVVIASYNFANNTAGTSEVTTTTLKTLFESCASDATGLSDIVSEVTATSKTYPTYNATYKNLGIKVGVSSGTNGFTISTSSSVTKVVVNAAGWSTSDTLSIAGVSQPAAFDKAYSQSGCVKELEYSFNSAKTSIQFSFTNRGFIQSIDFYGSSGGGGTSSYNVTYNGNGATSGVVPASTTSYSSGSQCTVLGNTGEFTKANCIFGGWNTASNGSGVSYKAGDQFSVTSETTLYARWITDYSESANLIIGGNYLNLPVQGSGNASALTESTKLVATDKMEYEISPSSGYYAYKHTSNGDNSFDTAANSKIFMGQKTAYLYNLDPLQKNIEKVEIYASAGCSTKAEVAIGLGTSVMAASYTTSPISLSTQNTVYTAYENQGSSSYRYFRVQVTSSTNASFQLKITYQSNSFTVTDSITNGSLSSTSSVTSGSELNTTIVPSTGYDLPASNAVTVTMGGTTLVSGTGYTYNTLSGAIGIASVTGNVEISAICPQIQTRAISTSLTNLNVKTGSATVLNVKDGATATVTLEVPDKHYTLPTTVGVTSNSVALTVDTDYTYNSSTGAVVMTYNSHYAGAIVITASGVRKSYKAISVSTEHCSETTDIRSIDDGDTESLIFSASTGYDLPNEVTVTGTSSYTWTKSTGTLQLTSQNTAISVSVTAIVHTTANTTNLTPGKYYLNYINNGNHYFSGVTVDGEGSYSSTLGSAMAFTLSLVGDDRWTLVNDSGDYLQITGTNSKNFALGEDAHPFSVGWVDEQAGTRGFVSVQYSRSIAWYADGNKFRTYAAGSTAPITLERVESDIMVDSTNADKNVLKGTTFNPVNAGFKAYLQFADGGNTEITSLATWTLDTTQINNNATLTVTYSSQSNYSKTVTGMNVYTTVVDHLSIDASAVKSFYYLGATLDTNGIAIQGLASDESVVVSSISASSCTFSPTTLNTVGSQTITVTYINEDESEATGTFVVTVVQTINNVDKDYESEYSKSFNQNSDKWTSHSEAQTWNGVSWTPTISWASSDPGILNVDSTKGQQIGSGSYPARTITLTTSGITGTIKSITVNASVAKDGDTTIATKVNNVAFGGEAQSLSVDPDNYLFEGSASGSIQIILSQPTTSKGIYIKSISIVYSGTNNIANITGHEEAQYAVVRFAQAFNAAMDTTDNCTKNMSTAWENATKAYTNPNYASESEKGFLEVISSLSSTEQDYAKDLIKYATVEWSDDSGAACVERMMKTYKVCVQKHGQTAFMSSFINLSPEVTPATNFMNFSSNTVTILVVISMVSVGAIGGYFFIRKRRGII